MNYLLVPVFDVISNVWILAAPLVFCSLVALAIIIDRAYVFRKALIKREKFLRELRPILQRRKIMEAIAVCDRSSHALARVAKAGLMRHDRSRREIKETLHEAGRREIPSLERELPALVTIYHVAPLLGLLGTVLALVSFFARLQEAEGMVDPHYFAQGIWVALLTTVGGLVIAIPVLVAYNYFVSRIDSFIIDLEESASEVVNLLAGEEEYEV